MADSKPINMTSTQAQNTLPADLRNEIYSALLSGTGIRNIEATLDHEMQATGFKASLKAYITYLLRSGECTSFDDIMARVNEKIRHDTHASSTNGTANGINGVNGHSKDSDDFELRLPSRVLTEASKTVETELDKVCNITVDENTSVGIEGDAATEPITPFSKISMASTKSKASAGLSAAAEPRKPIDEDSRASPESTAASKTGTKRRGGSTTRSRQPASKPRKQPSKQPRKQASNERNRQSPRPAL